MYVGVHERFETVILQDGMEDACMFVRANICGVSGLVVFKKKDFVSQKKETC